MKLLFIDETQVIQRDPNFFGICGIFMDESHYNSITKEMMKSFKKVKWDTSIEFKGAFLFSQSKGDSNVSIDKRIQLANEIISSSVANINSRLKALFVWNFDRDTKDNYIYLIDSLIKKLPSSKPKKSCAVFVDQNQKIPESQVCELINTSLTNKRYSLLEDINIIKKWRLTHTGSCICDLVAYLCAWRCLSNTPEDAQLSLFNEMQLNQHDLEKVRITTEIFRNLKNVNILKIPFPKKLLV
jgi:hypothetical protein